MNKRQADRLAKKIAKSNARVIVTAARLFVNGQRRTWELYLHDEDTGCTFVVASEQDWADRQEAKEFAAQHGA